MHGIDENTNYEERNVAKPKGDSWTIYKRLLGYVFEYKARLAISIVLAFFVAVSLGGIIVLAGNVVSYTFDTDANVAKALAHDKERIVSAAGEVRAYLGVPKQESAEAVANWFGETVDFMRTNKSTAMFWLCVIVILLSLFGGLSRFGQEYLCASIATFITVRLGLEMFDNVIRLPLRFFEKHTSGEIVARMTNDCFTAGRGLTAVFMKLFREPFKAIIFFCIAMAISPKLTLIGLGVLPLVGLIMIKVGQKVRKSMRRTLERIAGLQTVGKESVSGITIIKGFLMEDYVRSLVRREYAKLERQGLKMMRADAAIGPLTEFVMVLGFVVFILVSVGEVMAGRLDVGKLLQVYGALLMMLDPVRKLTAVNNAVQTSVASAERVFEFIDIKPDIVDAPGAIDIAPLREAIHFDDVHFSYDGKTEVLRGVTFDVKKGEMVAIVGHSGAGKSTLAKLVPRFYDVSKGSIRIDETDIRKATQSSLRAQISIVTQDTILFNASVRENISAGKTTYSDERLRDAVKAAHATEFVEKLYQKYDTVIGEAGNSLSGGQRQRLAIARAVIKDPAILVLDEATSSLDSESERAIQEALEEFVVGRTTVVIAHRLSTIQRADRILVLDEGRLAEQGTHNELLQRPDSIYRRLYETQFASSDKPPQADEGPSRRGESDGGSAPVPRPPRPSAPAPPVAAPITAREDAVY